MNLNIRDSNWYSRYPRIATFAHTVLMTLQTTCLGIIAEWILQMFFDITILGFWAITAIVGSAIAALLRLHVIIIAIALEEQKMTAQDNQGQAQTQTVKQINPLEKTISSIEETFQPVKYVISFGVLAATYIVITNKWPDIAEQLPTFLTSFPISFAALVSTPNIVLTNTTNASRIIGQGRLRTWAIKTGNTTTIATGIGTILVCLTGIIILVIRI